MAGRKALWFFQRIAPGKIRRVQNMSMQKFLVGEKPLQQDGDGFVRCIGMSVELKNRKPEIVSRVWFSKIRVGADGKVDPHHRSGVIQLAREEASQIERADSSVILASHHFARRRLSNLAEWRPEEKDLEALRAVVNTRAGREML